MSAQPVSFRQGSIWLASYPDLDLMAQGRTREEAEARLRSILDLHEQHNLSHGRPPRAGLRPMPDDVRADLVRLMAASEREG